MKHTVRSMDGGTKDFAPYTRGLAIKLHCTECMGYESDPKHCTDTKCALFTYRARTFRAYKSTPAKNPHSSP